MENEIEHSVCDPQELVAYLYNEMAVSERNSFEQHLLDCPNCTDAFAEISLSRLNVYEWNRDVFAHLATPVISIPVRESKAQASSWWRSIFAPMFAYNRFSMAGVSLALLLGIGLTFWVVTTSKDGVEVAVNNVVPVTEVVETYAVESRQPQAKDAIAEPSVPLPKAIETTSPFTTNRTRQRVPTRASRRVHAQAATYTVAIPTTNSPRLNDFEEETDTSVRLGDLLADFDSGTF